MSSKIGVQNIAHTNGTVAATIISDGTLYATNQIIQIVHVGNNTAFSSNDNNTWREYLSASITPKSSNSKILIQHTVSYGGNSNSYGAGKLARIISGASEVPLNYGSPHFTDSHFTDSSFPMQTVSSGQYKIYNTNFNFKDTPNTTSSITYKCYVKEASDGTDVVVNRSYANPGSGYNPASGSTIILTEIGG